MIEISGEEFVERLGGNEQWESSYYDIILRDNMVLLDRQGWEKLKNLIETNHLSPKELERTFEELKKLVG